MSSSQVAIGAERMWAGGRALEEKCMGCGVCEGACEFDAIRLDPDLARGEPLDIKKLISEQSE